MKYFRKFEIKSQQIKEVIGTYERTKISNSIDIVNVARNFMENIEIYESFYTILLDRSNHVIGYSLISQGGVSGTVVDAKIVAKHAIDHLASHIVLLHNHPSGNLKPSNADINLTQKLKNGLNLLDIIVLDHVIVTQDSHYSMSDNGYL